MKFLVAEKYKQFEFDRGICDMSGEVCFSPKMFTNVALPRQV